MREIKFRGKSTETKLHTKQWRFGSLLTPPNEACKPLIYERFPRPMHDGNGFWYEVEADTVGQFTGLYDTDGREIYEGDVLGNKYTSHYKFANAVVEWGVDGWLADCFSLREFLKLHTCIVVGNIYDNSELLPELPEEDDARD